MARSVIERQGVYIDASPFRKLARQLRATDIKASRNLRAGLLAAGNVVKDAAITEIAPHSKTIPPTIKVRASGTAVEVRAGGGDVAIAGLFEVGNTGGRGSASAARGGKFRHRVFGHDVWVDQPMHPYLLRAGLATQPITRRLIDAALVEAFRASGVEVI